jgi:GR25 family glycosyltransferase involved in LPS biosynthesis
MKQIDIEKAFVVNLDDKIQRWEHFQKLDIDIERIAAVDSRENWYTYRDFNLELVPYGRGNAQYFTQSKGAVGCYLSHYVIWKKIIENDYDWSLVLEDDADVASVENFISSNSEVNINDNVDVLQLNDRTQHDDFINYFNGTTAYLINNRGANILYNATHDFSYFKEAPDDVLQWRVDTVGLHGCEYLRDEIPGEYCWQVPNAIRVPADKFIGYTAHPSVPPEYRLNIEFEPRINIHEDFIVSDVTDPSDVLYWDMTCDQLAELELREDYMWWTQQDISALNTPENRCEEWCHSHTANWTTKCSWSTNACSGCLECNECDLGLVSPK